MQNNYVSFFLLKFSACALSEKRNKNNFSEAIVIKEIRYFVSVVSVASGKRFVVAILKEAAKQIANDVRHSEIRKCVAYKKGKGSDRNFSDWLVEESRIEQPDSSCREESVDVRNGIDPRIKYLIAGRSSIHGRGRLSFEDRSNK